MLVVPDWLSPRTIQPNDCSLLLGFASEQAIHSFAEIDVDLLRSCNFAKNDLPSFFKLVRLLGLYGVSFDGTLARYSRPAGRSPVLLDFPTGDGRQLHESSLDRNTVIFLNTLTLKRMDSLRGLGLDMLKELIQDDSNTLISSIIQEGGRIVDDPTTLKYFYAASLFTEPSEHEPIVDLIETHRVEESVVPYQLTALSEMNIEHLELNVRAFNVLTRNKVRTIGQLARLSPDQISSFKNCGKDTLRHIETQLENFLTPGQLQYLRSGTLPKDPIDLLPHPSFSPQPETPPIDVSDLLGEHLASQLEQFALNDIARLRELSPASLIILLGQEAGIKAWSLINNADLCGDDLIREHQKQDCCLTDVLSDSQISNPLFHSIKAAPLSTNTRAILERFGFDYLWQPYIVGIRQLIEEIGITAWAELSTYAYSLGLRTLPINISETECLLAQLKHVVLQIEEKLPQTLEPRALEIFYDRRLSFADKPTLDELGRKYNVTRERIRQIETRSIKRIQRVFSSVLLPIKAKLSELLVSSGGIMHWSTSILYAQHRQLLNVLMDILSVDIVFDDQSDLIWHRLLHSDISETGSNIYELIAQNVSNQLESKVDVVSSEMIKDCAATTLNEFAFPRFKQQVSIGVLDQLVAEVLNNYFVEVEQNAFRSKSASLFELVTYEFGKRYPNGAAIYKCGDEIWNTLRATIPRLEKRGGARYIQQVLTRSPKILLWDTGFYIHRDNVNPDMELVNELISDCIKQFEKGISDLKVHLVFERKKTRLIDGGIPSSAALYSLMRCVSPDRLTLDNYPRIRDANAAIQNLKQTELVEQFVKAHSPVSKRKVIEYFAERGWRQYETEQTLGRCTDIVKIGTHFLHISDIEVSQDALKALAHKIEQELLYLTHFNIRHMRAKYPVLWNAVCKRNLDAHSMENLLSGLQQTKFKINRLQVTLDNSIDRGLSEEISEWVRAYGSDVSIDQLEREFSHQRGYKQSSVKLALHWSDLLSCYKQCYIHPETLGIKPEIIDAVKQTLIEASEVRAKERLPHVQFDWLLKQYYSSLPSLNQPFDWTGQLLISITEQLDIAFIFHEAFVLKDNDFRIDDFDDLIGYLIGVVFDDYRVDLKKIENYAKAQGLLELGATLKRDDVFFNGSSVQLIDEGQSVMLSSIGRQRYTKV